MRDVDFSTLCHSCGFACQQRVRKTFRLPWLSPLGGWRSLTMTSIGKFVYMAHHFLLLLLNPFGLSVDREWLWFEHSLPSLRLACQERVLKTFPGSGYLLSEDGVVWVWYPLVNLHIWPTISSRYSSIPLALGLIVMDGDLSTLCHSRRVACQQRVLKTFPGPGYFHSEDGVVWPLHPLINLYLWLNPFGLRVDSEGWWFEHSLS